MDIAGLKKLLEQSEEILKEAAFLEAEIKVVSSQQEKGFFESTKKSFIEELKKANSYIPKMLAEEQTSASIPSAKKSYGERFSVSKSELAKYMEELQIEKENLKKLRKRLEKKESKEAKDQYKSLGVYAAASSKIFSKISMGLMKKDIFKSTHSGLRRANLPYLLPTYLSISLLSSLIVLFAFSLLAAAFAALGVINLMAAVMIIIASPFIAFLLFMVYPSAEASSIRGKIEQELPFAAIHMSAIAGSGVEPTRVFKILAQSPEYPEIGREMRKIVNQINFYGYDLVNALKETAKTTPSSRFADLLNGMSTIISTGGDLQSYLNKISNDTLLDYKLQRKRFTTVSETYADIYTGLLIAAPLMFMLILVLVNLIGGQVAGLSAVNLAALGIGAIALMNIGFLIFLQVSQPNG